MDGLLVHKGTSSGPIAADRPFVERYGDGTGMRTKAEMFYVPQQDNGIVGFAKLSRALDDLFENRFDIGGRRGDYPQDVTAPGLVGQRLPGLVEQPRVFDGDHGLVGERLDQLDLPCRKFSRFL